MKSVNVWAWVVGIIVWIVIGYIIARGPQPQFLVPGEKLWGIGPLPITNTLLTAWVAMILIIVGIDVLFFRERFQARLIANACVVALFAAGYLVFFPKR